MNPDESPLHPSEGSSGAPVDSNVPVVSGFDQSPGSNPVVSPSSAPLVQPQQPSGTFAPQSATPSVMPEQTPQPVSQVSDSYGPPVTADQPTQGVVSSQPSVMVGNMDGSFSATTSSSSPVISLHKPKRKLFSKSLLIILAAIVVLGGGTAAAYVGVILPNKPQNVLKSAIANSIQQTQLSVNGNVQASPSGSGGVALKLTFNGASDTVSKATDLQANLTVSGISFPVEVRLVDNNVYFKLGDVSSIVSLLTTISPEDGSVVKSLAAQLSNQWYVVDSTLTDESPEARCALNTSLVISNSDVKQLESLYSKNEFATIQSTSSVVLNGATVEKMNVVVNNSKVSNFVQSLSGLSLVKQLDKCTNSTNSALTNATSLKGSTDISVWVNKANKQIIQIGSTSPISSSGESYTYLVGFSYKPVSISVPANAKPVADLLSSLESSLGSSTL